MLILGHHTYEYFGVFFLMLILLAPVLCFIALVRPCRKCLMGM